MTIIVFKILGWILLVLLILLIVLLHFSVTVKIHAGRDGFVMRAKYLFLTLYPRRKKPDKDDGQETDDAFDVLSEDLTDEQLMQGLTAEQESALTASADKPESSSETRPEARKEDKKEEKKEDKGSKDKKKKSEKEDAKPAEDVSDVEDGEEEEEEEKKPGLREKIAGLRRKYEKLKPYIPMSWKWFKRLLKAVRISIDDLWVDVGRDDAHEAAIFYGSIQAFIGSTFAEFAKWFTFKVKRWDVNCRFTQNVIDGGTDVTVKVRPDTLIWLLIFTGVNFLYIWIKGKIAKKKAAKKAKTEAAQAAADTP